MNHHACFPRRNDRLASVEDVSSGRAHFLLCILGFSSWFFLAVPFASHRETYWWLFGIRTMGLSKALSYISVTYRPLAQLFTWLCFVFLDPRIFPTSEVRQTIVQLAVYFCFVYAWWLIFSAAINKKALSVVSLVAGAVYFPGYVHLFHIYGFFYVPVMILIGIILKVSRQELAYASEATLAATALVLILWHPFATFLFTAYYIGYYMETFRKRSKKNHAEAISIISICLLAIVLAVIIFPRADVRAPFSEKFLGWYATYRTSEVNSIASGVSYVLSVLTIWTLPVGLRYKAFGSIGATLVSVAFIALHIPLLLLWLSLVMLKLIVIRNWSLLLLTVAAVVIPWGAVIGAPVFGLFAVVLATYATSIQAEWMESVLTVASPVYLPAITIFVVVVIIAMRSGVTIPVLSHEAAPLLAEKERTFQLEYALSWLAKSPYCQDEVSFAVQAESPADDVKSVLNRQHRPPAAIGDVRSFWDGVLRCSGRNIDGSAGTNGDAVITFGSQIMSSMSPVYSVAGKYAGDITIWVNSGQRAAAEQH